MMNDLNYVHIHEVPGVPDLRIGVTDTGLVDLELNCELVTLGAPAVLITVLQLAKAQRERIIEENRPPDPDGLGPNQIGILRSLAGVSTAGSRGGVHERPYPGGGWVWDTDSKTRRLLDSLVKRKLAAWGDDHRCRLTEAGHSVVAMHVPHYRERRAG